MTNEIRVPELALVVLIGASGSGKSTLAKRLFRQTEIISSDVCRGLVSDDENDQSATGDAFELVHFLARKRLTRGLLTVIDATNVRAEDRKPLVQIARECYCLPVAIVVDTPEHLCHERNAARADRAFGPHVVRAQRRAMRTGIGKLGLEGFRRVITLDTPEACEQAVLVRERLWTNRAEETGPFDIIGDVHGCYDELAELLRELGWTLRQRPDAPEGDVELEPPPTAATRKLVFLGDLVDRGPKVTSVLRLAMNAVASGVALCVPGNHEAKLLRALHGKNVEVAHGLAASLSQLAAESSAFRARVVAFLDSLVSHYVLDGGRLVVAHAGMKESMQGRGSGAVRTFALYGETTGENDEFGLPVRYNWAADYRGRAAVIYGHTPVPTPEWLNNTLCIDTGCVFGGRLTALRWPERTTIAIAARAPYAEPRRPIAPPETSTARTLQQEHDDVLDHEDVSGKRQINTRLHHSITIRAENAAAALEVMSRFATDPRWLVYLPPTMSPCETSEEPGFLEHPRGAFEYFRANGVTRVICEEKHMGSRAVVVACRDESVVTRRFGHPAATLGTIYTRTGRPFFGDDETTNELLRRIVAAATRAGLWEELSTDWLSLDCELMPWSAKAQSLIRDQYATVGAAATSSLAATVRSLEAARFRGADVESLLRDCTERLDLAERYVASYRRYCWDVGSIADLRLAPFHLLASEGAVHADRTHEWHMNTLARLEGDEDPVLIATPWRAVDLADPASEKDATDWWSDHVGRGGEGMVVKPMEFVVRGARGPVQPAVKVRGPEYLRIIYGPEYTLPAHLDRLRKRSLAAKRSLALREFSLGIEALERFVRREPLRRVHECVFGVLALESEPIDPRL